MNRVILAFALNILVAATASAAASLISVPAVCGTAADVLGTLAVKMPNPEEIGSGRDREGTPIATLFRGNGYWALIATMSSNKVCVVASGHNWTVIEPPQEKAF